MLSIGAFLIIRRKTIIIVPLEKHKFVNLASEKLVQPLSNKIKNNGHAMGIEYNIGAIIKITDLRS